MVVEATEQGSPTPNHDRWEDVILGQDYRYATFDGLNRYYVRSEDEALIPVLQVPPNFFDQFWPHEYDVKIYELRLQEAAARSESTARRCKLDAVRGRLEMLRYQLTRRPAGARSLRLAS